MFVEVRQWEPGPLEGAWVGAILRELGPDNVLVEYRLDGSTEGAQGWAPRSSVRAAQNPGDPACAGPGAAPGVDLWPAWAELGCDVEAYDDAGAFATSYFCGEVIELLPKGAGSAAGCATTARARVQSRLCVPEGAYSSSGRLVVEQIVPLSRLRPRPPPPPADFLAASPAVGMRLQLRSEGLWWEVRLDAVVTASAPGSEAGSGGAGALGSGADPASPAQTPLGPRYAVSSEQHADVRGCVAGSELRPEWVWSGWRWTLAAAAGTVDAPVTSGAHPAPECPLRGVGSSEVAGRRVRVWAEAGHDTLPAVGMVLGYVAGRGLSVRFDDGVFWVALAGNRRS